MNGPQSIGSGCDPTQWRITWEEPRNGKRGPKQRVAVVKWLEFNNGDVSFHYKGGSMAVDRYRLVSILREDAEAGWSE